LSQIGILERLPALRLEGWEKAVVKRLSDTEKSVRVAAIGALKGSKDTDALDAIVKVVDADGDPDVKSAAAAALSASTNPKYSAYGLYFAIRGSDEAAALAALDELARLGKTDAAAEIVAALAHQSRSVGARAASTLRALGLDAELAKGLRNSQLDPAVRLQIAIEMSSSKDKDLSFSGLAFLALNAPAEQAIRALSALKGYKDPEPLDAVVAALTSPHPEVRVAAAQALVSLKEEDALPALAKAWRESLEVQPQLEKAMVELLLASEKLSDLEDRIGKDKDELLRRCDYQALAQKAADAGRFAAVREVLVTGLDDKSELARGGAILALSKQADEETLVLLAAKAKDASALVRTDVAVALRAFPVARGTDVLLELAKDSEPSVAVAAIDTLAARAESAVLRDLVKMSRPSDVRVRTALLRAASAMYTDETRTDAVAYISNALFDDDRTVKLAAIAALGGLNDAQAVGSLALFMQDPDPEYKSAALRALGTGQHPDAIPLISQAVASGELRTRLVAIEAALLHGSIKFVPEFKMMLIDEQDPQVKGALEAAVLKLESQD
jgi:HEAT repeat protein